MSRNGRTDLGSGSCPRAADFRPLHRSVVRRGALAASVAHPSFGAVFWSWWHACQRVGWRV